MTDNQKVIIACASIQPELELLYEDNGNAWLVFMDQNLHRFPEKMTGVLQAEIDKHTETAKMIVLGYGLCSNGVVGLLAPGCGLYVPRAHDCINILIGSTKDYDTVLKKRPGTYYLTKSWIDNKKDPLGLLKNEYTERVGREDAEWAINQELKNYTHICYIETNINETEKYKEIAQKNAEYFNKEFIVMNSSKSMVQKILFGPYDEENFIYIEPGQEVRQKSFFK